MAREFASNSTDAWIYQVHACNASDCSASQVSRSSVGGATSYTLQEQANGGAWATSQSSSAASKAISGKGNASYGYRAQACNAGGCGPWSGTGSITVHLSPATPAIPSVSTTGPSYRPVVHVSWTAVAGATNYQLGQTDPEDGVTVSNFGTTTSFSALMLVNGEVAYRVSACSSRGCSPYSDYGSVYLNAGGNGLVSAPAPATSTQPTEAAQ